MAKQKKNDAAEKGPRCPVTRAQFAELAKPLMATIDGVPMMMTVKAGAHEFSTGSIGWNYSGKISHDFGNGVMADVQVGINLTLVGSKELPRE